jgi:hypothetical protein
VSAQGPALLGQVLHPAYTQGKPSLGLL